MTKESRPKFRQSVYGEVTVSWADISELTSCLAAISATPESSGVGLRLSKSMSSKALNVLSEASWLKHLIIEDGGGSIDGNILHRLGGLQTLTIHCKSANVDLTNCRKLRSLNVLWAKTLTLPDQASHLERLTLWKYGDTKRTLSNLPRLPSLQYLELNRCALRSLDGLSHFPHLRELSLHYMQRLESVRAIGRLTSLSTLRMENCARVADWACLAASQSIQLIRLLGCGSIQSLEFVKGMSSLRDFWFGRTDVLDGNMLPLLTVPEFDYDYKRHFSHKPEDLRRLRSQPRQKPLSG